MKKIFNYLLIVTLLLGTAVSFNSCKDDDEEDGKNGKGYNIVGTWKCSYDTGYYLWTLNADGTYVWVDKDYGYEADTDYEPTLIKTAYSLFTWVMKVKFGI